MVQEDARAAVRFLHKMSEDLAPSGNQAVDVSLPALSLKGWRIDVHRIVLGGLEHITTQVYRSSCPCFSFPDLHAGDSAGAIAALYYGYLDGQNRDSNSKRRWRPMIIA